MLNRIGLGDPVIQPEILANPAKECRHLRMIPGDHLQPGLPRSWMQAIKVGSFTPNDCSSVNLRQR